MPAPPQLPADQAVTWVQVVAKHAAAAEQAAKLELATLFPDHSAQAGMEVDLSGSVPVSDGSTNTARTTGCSKPARGDERSRSPKHKGARVDQVDPTATPPAPAAVEGQTKPEDSSSAPKGVDEPSEQGASSTIAPLSEQEIEEQAELVLALAYSQAEKARDSASSSDPKGPQEEKPPAP